MTIAITAIVRPSHRETETVDEFAAALAGALGSPVPVVEGTLASAPPDGYLLAFSTYELEDYAAIADRVILMNTNGATVRDYLEHYGLVAAIEWHRYFRWQTARDRETGRGVIGRKDLAAACDATLTGYYDTDHYDTLASGRHPDLPTLLAAYLRAHAGEVVPAPPAQPRDGRHTVGNRRIVVGEMLDAGVTTGVYRGHVVGRPEERRLITLSGGHEASHSEMRARLALPVAGVTPLELIADVDDPDGALWGGDCMVEIEPAGVPVRTLAPLAEPAAIRIGIGVARIAARAHAAGFVLAGIRPEAIYVTGGRDRPEVSALAPRGTTFIQTGRRAHGLPALAALYERETLTDRPRTAATDVFALCATLFELVAGAHPFGEPGDQLGRLAAAQPIDWPGSPALGEVLRSGLAADPAERPTATELAEALSRARSTES